MRCLLQFLIPEGEDVYGVRRQPRIIYSRGSQYNFLEVIAIMGLERSSVIEGSSMLDFHPIILQQLHEYFANTDLLMVRSRNPLLLALRQGDATLSELFMTWMGSSNVSKLVKALDDHSYETLLRAACEQGLVDLAMCFINAGAQIEGLWSHHEYGTYLHSTCRSKRIFGSPEEKTVKLVGLLHEQGDDLFAQDRFGQTPLHLAAISGKVTVVRYIIKQTHSKQQRHPKDKSGKTPLVLAQRAEVRQEFAPWQPNSNDATSKDICKSCRAEVSRWHGGPECFRVSIPSTIHELLYNYDERGNNVVRNKLNGGLRWVHLPANNIEWCEDLLLGWYLGRNASCDTKDLEAARQPFDQQHVPRTPQERFLRPGVHCTQRSRHIVFIAAPYMDYETSSNLEQMQNALRTGTSTSCSSTASVLRTSNKALYDAYVGDAALHPRRALGQYLYSNIDTRKRDRDQIVQRYQENQRNRSGAYSDVDALKATLETTTIMVDQLWMWILGDDLIVACGAKHWNATTRDQGVLARFKDSTSLLSLSSGAEPSELRAADVAGQLMASYFGTFDRHSRGKFNLQFMSMFEQSIGAIGYRDSELFTQFSAACSAERGNKTSRETSVKALGYLTSETLLLSELKDILNELHIMETILVDQRRVTTSLLNIQTEIVRNHQMPLFGSIQVGDPEEPFEPMNTVIDQGMHDIARLESQASKLSGSLHELLQMKQAQYNAFRAKSSHDLAFDAAKQGRAVLVFTIVTIIFSPLSFVAAFFTMNLTIFPEKLPLSYVSRYIFGFGLAVATPCIILAFSLGWWTSSWKRVKKALYITGPEPTVDRDGLAKDESLEIPAQAAPAQEVARLFNTSSTVLQSNEGHPSPSLREVRTNGTPNMTAGLTRRWQNWVNSKTTYLPR